MPHLTLYYTANIKQALDFQSLFSHLHQILARVGGINIGNCKSRALKLEDFYIGTGEPDQAFVHLDLRFLEGRSDALKAEIGQQVLDTLREFFVPSLEQYRLQITVEISDIRRQSYFKIPEGSFTLQ